MQSFDADGHEIAALEAARAVLVGVWSWARSYLHSSRTSLPASSNDSCDAGAVIHAPSTRLSSVRFGRLCFASLYFTLASWCRESVGFPRRGMKRLEQRGVYVIRLGSLASWLAPKTFRISQPRMPIFS